MSEVFVEGLADKAVHRWGGWLGDPMAFHQKENGDCVAYVSISAGGIKPEGEAMESRPTADSAAADLFEQIANYLGTRSPIWRQFPEVSRDGADFYATARLVRSE